MLRRVEGCPGDRLRQAMGALHRFKRADLEVAGRIGKGAYGGVWQATVLHTKSDVVVKVVFPDPDLDPEEAAKAHPSEEKLSSFRREIEIMSVLGQHPNITAILGITSDSRVLVLEEAMIDLHQMIKSQKRSLCLSVVRRWSRELMEGVAYLHSISIIHRDLKPSNLLIFKDMTLKLGDFGLAREADPNEQLPVRREICTLWYRAPELIMGDTSYTSRIDVWSAGCIMLEMLVGRCVTAGRVEDVCKCPKPTHFNYNSDQLAKIFRLVGTPTDSKFLSNMHCLSHFQGWPAFPRKLEELVNGACIQERIKAGDEGAAEILAEKWTSCLLGMLMINPAERLCASDVMSHAFWKQCSADVVGEMPLMRSRNSSTGSQASTLSSHSSSGQRSSEKPKLAMGKNKRNSAPASSTCRVSLQPLQAQHQRRMSHLIPFEGLAGERAGQKDYACIRRVSSAYSTDVGDLKVDGGGVSSIRGKPALMQRSSSNENSINNPGTGSAIVRVSSIPGYAKGKARTSWNFIGRSDNTVIADSIVN